MARRSWVIVTLVVAAFALAAASEEAVVTAPAWPGERNIRVIYYDQDFLFLARHFGSSRDEGGNTEPLLFVHSKAHDRWLHLRQVSTRDAKLGKSWCEDPDGTMRMVNCSVTWDFTGYASKSAIELPLRTSGSIAFPDTIAYEAETARFTMSFFTCWEVESATTALYLTRQDLLDQFDKIGKR